MPMKLNHSVAAPTSARIAALRRIDWGGLGLNFAIVFSPGYIEEAPHGLLASVYAPPGRDGAIARRVAAALPSVTMIRVGDVIGQIGAVLGQVALAIRAAAAVTVAAGIAVPLSNTLGGPSSSLEFWTLPALAGLALWLVSHRALRKAPRIEAVREFLLEEARRFA